MPLVEVPKKTDISIIGNSLALTVRTIFSPDVGKFEDQKSNKQTVCSENSENSSNELNSIDSISIKFNSGKAALFACLSNVLQENVISYLFKAIIIKKNCFTSLATVKTKWDENFLHFIKESKLRNNLTPYAGKGVYELFNWKNEITVNENLSVRLSHFGTNIQTQFQFLDQRDLINVDKKCLIRCMTTRTANVSVSGSDSPLYFYIASHGLKNWYKIAWFELSDKNIDQKINIEPIKFKTVTHNFINSFKNSTNKINMISIIERPVETEFYNLNLEACSVGFVVGVEKKEYNEELINSKIELTPDNINNLLNGNKHCLAAAELKDFHLGTLLKKSYLTLLYHVLAPVPCSLSNTYGVFEYHRLYGTLSNNKGNKKKKCVCKKNDCKPLRLTGGGLLKPDNGLAIKSPLLECKEIMNELDNILEKYYKALRSCAQTEKKFESSCGSSNCAYAKYKKGLTNDDAFMEFQYLNPGLLGKCGSPKKKFPVKENLPTTDRNCPESLLKGIHKHVNCPFLTPDFKCLKVLQPKGPCGSETYLYALPLQFNNPTCCFTEEPKNEDLPSNPDLLSDNDLCQNLDCPFKQKINANVLCDNSAYAYNEKLQNDDKLCKNPDCPYNQSFDNEFCKNPESPYNQNLPNDDELCENPDCPYNQNFQNDDKLCKNPDCPFNKEISDDLCKNSECPYNQGSNKDVCSLEDCPYTRIGNGDLMSNYICDNPTCPYANLNKKTCIKKLLTQTNQTDKCPFLKENLEMLHKFFEQLQIYCQKNTIESKMSIKCNENNETQNDHKQFSGTNQVARSIELQESNRDEMEIPCTILTCQADDGTVKCGICENKIKPVQCKSATEPIILTCTEISNGKRKTKTEPGIHKKKRKWKFSKKYIYSIGDKYPGVQIGHKECTLPGFRIPQTMGWLWNIHTPCLTLKPRRGWKPGAIGKTIATRIKQHRKMKGLPMLTLPIFSKSKTVRNVGNYASSSDVSVATKPTLSIKKRVGAYFITMNPLKDPKTLEDNENPYMDCTPIQFKITKNKKKDETGDIYKICRYNNGDTPETENIFEDKSLDSSSSDSELDIEFTPPAGIIRPERLKKKKHVVHTDTQYNVKDFKDLSKKGKNKKSKGKGKEKKSKKNRTQYGY